ncbi:MAG TPA: TRAP transporter small permease [Burkholderiales bacterium]
MRHSRRIEGFVLAVPRFIVGGAIFVSIAINFANIVGRYLFDTPILWAEEILDYLMVWSVFLAAVLVTWQGRHIKMDLLSVMLRPPVREAVNFIGWVIFMAVCLFMIGQSWTVTRLAWQMDQRSVAAEIPMALAHAGVLLGFAGMLVAAALRFRAYVTNAFGSETEAVQKQVTETFGTFE